MVIDCLNFAGLFSVGAPLFATIAIGYSVVPLLDVDYHYQARGATKQNNSGC
jgi:hypothetical protein